MSGPGNSELKSVFETAELNSSMEKFIEIARQSAGRVPSEYSAPAVEALDFIEQTMPELMQCIATSKTEYDSVEANIQELEKRAADNAARATRPADPVPPAAFAPASKSLKGRLVTPGKQLRDEVLIRFARRRPPQAAAGEDLTFSTWGFDSANLAGQPSLSSTNEPPSAAAVPPKSRAEPVQSESLHWSHWLENSLSMIMPDKDAPKDKSDWKNLFQ